MSSNQSLGAALCVAIVALATPVSGADVLTLQMDGAVRTLGLAGGLGGGIPTGANTQPVVVRLADGRVAELVIENEALQLRDRATDVAEGPSGDMLPDGERTEGANDIAQAFLTGPTRRYRHGILGDDIEAGGLRALTKDGMFLDFELDERSVFEDRRARLVDLDMDGRDEIVVVRSYVDAGAAISVFGVNDGALVRLDEAPAIGRPSRWLNPAGAADFDGDGFVEIAYVETPHIGGTLRLLEYRDRALHIDHQEFGFSNHAIGSRIQDLSAVLDWNGDGVLDIVAPDARRNSLKVVTFSGGQLTQLDSVNLTGPLTTGIFALPGTDKAVVVYGTGGQTLHAARP